MPTAGRLFLALVLPLFAVYAAARWARHEDPDRLGRFGKALWTLFSAGTKLIWLLILAVILLLLFVAPLRP